jgi:endonuclease/exonuclease/phosphatase family metal-dependent hydrolase
VGASSATGQCRLEISFVRSRWSPINGDGANYGYTYLESGARGVLTATYAKGRIQVLARGALASCDHRLPQQAPVGVELRVEAQRNCAALGGNVETNLPEVFVASNAPAPARCSDADATVAQLNILHGHACDPPGPEVPDVGDQCRVVERIELLLRHVVASGCPDVVTMQEHIVKRFVTSGTDNPLPLPVPVPVTKGPLENTVMLIRDRLPGLVASCGFLYDVVFDPENQTQNPSPSRGGDEEMILTRYPALEAAVTTLYTPVSPFFERHVLHARIDHPLGPLDVYTTHLSSSSDNGGDLCGVQLELLPGVPSPPCPPECDPSKSARVCQAVQLAQLVASTHDVPQPAIVSGDFNSPATAPPEDATLAQLTGLGWVDSYLAAGNPECNPATGIGCTSGRNDFSLIDLENPLSQETERIDYALVVPPGPGSSCAARVEAAGDADGDGTATRIFTDLPDLPCGPGKVCWPSDHEGAELDLECAP